MLSQLNLPYMRKIFKLGMPVAMQSILFAIFAMILARIVGRWGALPIAVQSVGAQIEALSWMTASGFATALGAFVGQNYGAGKWDRIYKGFLITVGISSIIGLAVTILFVGFGRQVFSIFIPEPEAIKLGSEYLKILGYSQIFMCLEIATSGAFNGIGRTMPPSIIGTTLTGMRIPIALVLALGTSLGMLGVWWSLSITSVLKGIILFIWFYRVVTKHPDNFAVQENPLQYIRLIPNRIRQQFLGTKTK
jgi:Na+-driven multidrug efflux pump